MHLYFCAQTSSAFLSACMIRIYTVENFIKFFNGKVNIEPHEGGVVSFQDLFTNLKYLLK